MPLGSKSKKRSASALVVASSKKKKTYPKRKFLPVRSLASIGLGFPAKLVQTLKYCENVSFTTGATLARYHFSTNGIYDPNTTGTGHQPGYFDVMSAIYNHYVVMGSRCKITFAIDTASTTKSFWCAGLLNDDTTAISGISMQAITEQTQAKLLCLSPNNSDQNSIVMTYSAKKSFGTGYLDQSNLQGNSTANPTEQQYFDYYVICVDGSTAATVYAHVEIEYIVMWREIREITPS